MLAFPSFCLLSFSLPPSFSLFFYLWGYVEIDILVLNFIRNGRESRIAPMIFIKKNGVGGCVRGLTLPELRIKVARKWRTVGQTAGRNAGARPETGQHGPRTWTSDRKRKSGHVISKRSPFQHLHPLRSLILRTGSLQAHRPIEPYFPAVMGPTWQVRRWALSGGKARTPLQTLAFVCVCTEMKTKVTPAS